MDTKTEEILQSIHSAIRMQNIRLTKEEIERADREILPFLEEVIAPVVEEPKVRIARTTLPIPKQVIQKAVLRYYATVQGTVPILESLDKTVPLCYLDGTLVSQFPKEEYLKILKRERGCIKRFMESLLGATKEEREPFIRDFAYVVQKDPRLLYIGIGHDEEEDNFNLLTRRNFELFGRDFFLEIDRRQRMIVNSLIGRVEKEDADKLKEIFQKYPDYHPLLPFHADFLKYFTIEELAAMEPKDEEMYQTAIRKNCVSRIKELLAINPSFYCPEGFIREEILRSLSNETIMGLTEEGIQELANLPVPEISKVTVFPIQRINRVLMRDKMRKIYQKVKERVVPK